MFSLIIGAVLNIILDPIIIFGLFGCPAMGIRGAAIATVIGQISGAIAALLFNRLKNPLIHITFKNYHFNWHDVIDIYRVGLPTIIMQAIGSVMTFVVNSILLSVSTTVTILCGYFSSGLGNGVVNMFSAAIRQLILLIPCLCFFIKALGITYCWYAFWIAEITACIYSYCTSHKLLKNILQ